MNYWRGALLILATIAMLAVPAIGIYLSGRKPPKEACHACNGIGRINGFPCRRCAESGEEPNHTA